MAILWSGSCSFAALFKSAFSAEFHMRYLIIGMEATPPMMPFAGVISVGSLQRMSLNHLTGRKDRQARFAGTDSELRQQQAMFKFRFASLTEKTHGAGKLNFFVPLRLLLAAGMYAFMPFFQEDPIALTINSKHANVQIHVYIWCRVAGSIAPPPMVWSPKP